MRSCSRLAIALLLSLVACDRRGASSAGSAGSASAAPAVQAATASGAPPAQAASSEEGFAAQHVLLAYQGKVGQKGDFRMVLDRSGDHLEGIYARGGEDVAVRGDMKDKTRFTLTEIVPKGKKAATLEGEIDGMRITGTWKDPGAATAMPFSAGPLDPFGAKAQSFEQTYLGSLGSKTRIRMKLKKDGEKLTGVYRYTRSKEDLRLLGTVSEADGRFELVESNAQGATTGRMKGVFLERPLALGRWTSPDGTRTFPFTLRNGDVFPEPVALVGAGKVVPQEDYEEHGKFCTMSIFFPEVTGTPNKTAENALNRALRKKADIGKNMWCGDAREELPYQAETMYAVVATRPSLFALRYQFYEYAGGAHGMHGIDCYAADTDKGTLTKLASKLLSPDARKKADVFVNAALKKENGVQKLTEAGFNADEVSIGDETSLCIDGTDLVVQFQEYEVAAYAMGAPSAKIGKADAAPLVSATPLEPFFK
jgi:hypothetical protein